MGAVKGQGARAEGKAVGRTSEVRLTVMDQELSSSLLRTATGQFQRFPALWLCIPLVPIFSFILPVVETVQLPVQIPYSRKQNPVLSILLRSPEISLFIAMGLVREYFLNVAGFLCGFSVFLILI